MGKGGSSKKEMAKGLAVIELVAFSPKFKWRRVSMVRDFPPRCGRVTASNFGLSRQIAVDQSSQGNYAAMLVRLCAVIIGFVPFPRALCRYYRLCAVIDGFVPHILPKA
ncbi:hypothetical protein J1N35_041452 [Gossypium stocksii]|uniref:Uncharacterized protein n=1 Tax=Gossypium stocksii TaxID=47602 RepID=A0A9D3UFI7_9ROSI|nr:hypothetical protein J1N35_041452 [Gossypium stocksii]